MERSLSPWLRAFFLLVTLQALVVAAGVVWPALIPRLLPWDASPLNARFIAALYAMGALSALLCLVAGRYAEARITLIEIGLVTLLLLLITLPRLGEFVAPRPLPLGWLLSYTADPLLAALLLWRMRGHDRAPAGASPLALVLIAYAAALGVIGMVLLALPGLAARIWPWELPAVLGQLYSVFFLGMAACAALAAREPRWAGVRIYLIANLFLIVLVLVVSLLHIERFRAGPATLIWFGFCLIAAAGFARALLGRMSRQALIAALRDG
jgi:hypothetical protein